MLKFFMKSQPTQWQRLMIYKGATLPLQTVMIGSLQRPGSNASHTSASQVFSESQRLASNQVWAVILAAREYPTPSPSLIRSLQGLLKDSLDPLEDKSKVSTGFIYWAQGALIILSHLLTEHLLFLALRLLMQVSPPFLLQGKLNSLSIKCTVASKEHSFCNKDQKIASSWRTGSTPSIPHPQCSAWNLVDLDQNLLNE